MNIQIGAADVARAMDIDVVLSWDTHRWGVYLDGECLIEGETWEDANDVAKRFFKQLAREVFLK